MQINTRGYKRQNKCQTDSWGKRAAFKVSIPLIRLAGKQTGINTLKSQHHVNTGACYGSTDSREGTWVSWVRGLLRVQFRVLYCTGQTRKGGISVWLDWNARVRSCGIPVVTTERGDDGKVRQNHLGGEWGGAKRGWFRLGGRGKSHWGNCLRGVIWMWKG